MPARRVMGALLAACLVAACGGGADARDDQADAPAPAVPPPRVRALLALDGEGLRFVDTTTGTTRAIAFGAPAADVVAAMTTVAGAPQARSSNGECGAGPLDFVSFAGGLDVTVQDDRFVGWSVRPADGARLRTMSGIGLRSTRAALDSAYAAKVEETTLGIEFLAGGLQGILESDAPSARITDLWAGTSCVMR